jgi:predicted XRE-type DNA-binding protein
LESYILNFLKVLQIYQTKKIANLLEIESSTVVDVLSGKYKENDFMNKSSMEIDKNVKL